jgi:hypothetical protein
MKKQVSPGKTYIGVVEDNKDPNKDGKVKVRVLDIYDEQSIEDIPWASPWKDLTGGQFSIPELGKVVIVVFDQGDMYKPEYIFTEHWNVNLENKLKSLSDSDYLSMKSLIFDHKTQIYSNDSEGLKIDHKFNNINIKDNSINLNLKDNNMMINIGDSTADQQMILGNNWMDWFDQFIESLMNNMAFLGNAGAPVLASPEFIRILTKYKSDKDPKFLSHHVNVVNNDKVSTVKNSNREETAQAGDTWKSTKKENTVTTVSNETNQPVEGNKPPYDDKFSEPPTDVPGVSTSDPIVLKNIDPLPDKSSIQSNKDIEKIIWFMNSKGYKVYDGFNELNIVAIRDKDNGDVTNKFDDILYIFYRNQSGNMELVEYKITTVPGLIPNKIELPKNVSILRLGQYVEQLKMDTYGGDDNHRCLSFDSCAVHRNTELDFYDWDSPTEIGNFAISIHRTSDPSSSENVYNYSEGSQVFKNRNQYDQFIKLCDDQVKNAKKELFTYTIFSKSEFDKYDNPDVQREKISNLLKEPTVVSVLPTTPVLPTVPVVGVTSSTMASNLEILNGVQTYDETDKSRIKYADSSIFEKLTVTVGGKSGMYNIDGASYMYNGIDSRNFESKGLDTLNSLLSIDKQIFTVDSTTLLDEIDDLIGTTFVSGDAVKFDIKVVSKPVLPDGITTDTSRQNTSSVFRVKIFI